MSVPPYIVWSRVYMEVAVEGLVHLVAFILENALASRLLHGTLLREILLVFSNEFTIPINVIISILSHCRELLLCLVQLQL
jgi:hypothetical protein